MIRYHIRLPDDIKAEVACSSPLLKRKFKMALALLQVEPRAGKPLGQELSGLWSYPVVPFRIIYAIEPTLREVQVLRFGHRRNVYDLPLQFPVRDRGKRKGFYRRLAGTASLLR